MERRKFIKNTSLAGLSVPFLFNNWNYEAITDKLFSISRGSEDKVLVLVRLNGGNDGLNTLIPLDGYANLKKQRSNILLPENKLITITPENALHTAMTGMADMFQDGKLSIIQNVGYPEQNRSHFRSMDIWSSGSTDINTTTGWMGRHLDKKYPGFPDAYPDDTNPDPFAISMGYEVSSTCQGLVSNFCNTVINPNDAVTVTASTANNDGSYYGSHMQFLSTMFAQTNTYGNRVLEAAKKGNNLSTKYDSKNDLATQLKYVAQMISGGLQTNVYVVNINGFDTHDSQVDSDITQGKHADLLRTVSDAIAAFQDDITLLGLEKKVAGMTFSEFGRQIASNASIGTDHGEAAPLFLFGACLETPIYGANPTISDQVVDQAAIPMQIDFRDIYASILKDWFEVPSNEIQTMFDHTITYHSVIGGCTLDIEDKTFAQKTSTVVYPNPAVNQINVQLDSQNEFVRIVILDLSGREIQTCLEKNLDTNRHTIPLEIIDLKPGNYILNIQKKSGSESLKFIKVKSN